MPLGWFPKRLGKPYIVPSYIKPLSIIDYKVEEDNLWNACQFSVAVILSYRGRWFWETLNLSWERINLTWETLLLKSCFSVDANLLQGILKSGLAVVKRWKNLQKCSVIKNKYVLLHFQSKEVMTTKNIISLHILLLLSIWYLDKNNFDKRSSMATSVAVGL